MRIATKRVIASMAASLLTATAFVAVESTAANAVSEANTFTVTAPAENGGAKPKWKLLVDAFNAANPTYKAVLVEDNSDGKYDANLLTKLRAGGAADVMKVQPGYGAGDAVLGLVKGKYLAPLNDTGAAKAPNASNSIINVSGKVYAVSMGMSAGSLVQNATLMAKDGVAWPKTVDELLVACKTARTKGNTFFVLAGALWPNLELLYSNVSAGEVYAKDDSWNVKRNANKVKFATTQEWQNTLSTIKDMHKAGCFQDGVAAGTFDNIDAKFIGAKTAYAAFIPGSLSVVFGNGPMRGNELKTRAFPGNKKVTFDSNYALGINAKTKKLAAAKKFITYAASAAGQKVYADAGGYLPLTFDKNTVVAPQYSEIVGMLKSGNTFSHPKTTWNTTPAVTIKLGTGVQGIMTGQATIDQVLKSADAAW
jgi:raffinose/stachyose/melibiose transport system substrate-binding protein